MQKTIAVSFTALVFTASPVFAGDWSEGGVDLSSDTYITCTEMAIASGTLYADIFNSVVNGIATTCNDVTGDQICVAGTCPKQSIEIGVDDRDFSITPTLEADSEGFRIAINASFRFTSHRERTNECVSPASYPVVEQVSLSIWNAALGAREVADYCAHN